MSLWTRGGQTWKDLIRRIFLQIYEDQIFGHCAELAYYFLFSLFPLLLFLTTLLGYLAEANDQLRVNLFTYLARISPSQDIINLMTGTLQEITQGKGTAKLSIGFLVAIWASSNGMLAVGNTLNLACGLKETRPWWRRRLGAMLLTVAFAVLLVAALALMIVGGDVGEALAQRVGLGTVFTVLLRFLQWPLVLVFLFVSFEVVYNYAPNLKGHERGWGTPGAVTAVTLWLGATLGYRIYLGYFHAYSRTYGSLGAVILLLVWFYLTAFALLMGGEVNSEIARARDDEQERKKARNKGRARVAARR
ncbi:MAG TPA: YihY/virulence factor BrkB family protein [Thermoanaerobaculia bacterium]|nr:YihY/virulence factor BrkB family protein [Thermoanaerobaculia bacterium]